METNLTWIVKLFAKNVLSINSFGIDLCFVFSFLPHLHLMWQYGVSKTPDSSPFVTCKFKFELMVLWIKFYKWTQLVMSIIRWTSLQLLLPTALLQSGHFSLSFLWIIRFRLVWSEFSIHYSKPSKLIDLMLIFTIYSVNISGNSHMLLLTYFLFKFINIFLHPNRQKRVNSENALIEICLSINLLTYLLTCRP